MLSELITGGEWSLRPGTASDERAQILKISDNSSTGKTSIWQEGKALLLRNGYILMIVR